MSAEPHPEAAAARASNADEMPASSWWSALRAIVTPDPELDPDNRFEMSHADLVKRLATDDPDVALEILEEAKAISARTVEDRTESVERRAATLQSATAIAGSFSLAGGTLVVSQIQGSVWQLIVGGLLLWVTSNLGLCGWRATQAASSIHRWSALPSAGVLRRAQQSLAQSRIERASQVLRAAGCNARYARFKVTMLRRAGRHLTRAALGFPLLVAAIVVYTVAR